VVATNELSHRALKPGDDPLSLGHWCWVALRILHSHHVWIILMYWPCKAVWALSTYQQHLWTLGKLKQDLCPKQAILDDLAKEITAWQEAGNMVIIVTDFNEDIRADNLWLFSQNLACPWSIPPFTLLVYLRHTIVALFLLMVFSFRMP